jgi:hypothetical protein
MEVKCLVKNCRYNTYHYTDSHQCGTCKKLGHGRIECKKMGNCCKYCNKINHITNCPMNGIEVCDNVDDDMKYRLDTFATSKNLNNGQYTMLYGGMGSTWYIRCNNNNNEYIYVDYDNLGQYNINTSDLPRFNAFIENYVEIL